MSSALRTRRHAGSIRAGKANSSRGLGREGTGSHKAGVAGSTPVPTTTSLLISFNGRTLGCGPGDAEFEFSQSGPDTGLVQWQNAGLQNPMSTVRFSQPVPIFFALQIDHDVALGPGSSRSARCRPPARRSGRAGSRPSRRRARSRRCGRPRCGTTIARVRRTPRQARAGSESPVPSGRSRPLRANETSGPAPGGPAGRCGGRRGEASDARRLGRTRRRTVSVWMRLAATPQPARPAVRSLMKADGPQT